MINERNEIPGLVCTLHLPSPPHAPPSRELRSRLVEKGDIETFSLSILRILTFHSATLLLVLWMDPNFSGMKQ